MRYRKKPVEVEAVQWTGENAGEIYEFVGGKNIIIHLQERVCPDIIIITLEGEHHASVGDYIICGVNGEFYPCKPDIFAKTYEPVKE